MSLTHVKRYLQDIKVGDFKFKGIYNFTYLGSVLGRGNKIMDIHPKFITANYAYLAHNEPFSQNTKLKFIKL
jgi:hypothetical protein